MLRGASKNAKTLGTAVIDKSDQAAVVFCALRTMGRLRLFEKNAAFIERFELDPDEFADSVESFATFNEFFSR